MKSLRYVVVAILVIASGGARAEMYQNEQYRFSVDLPGGKTVCRSVAPSPDHGLIILLNSSDCEREREVAGIQIFASYNVAHEARTTAELSKHYCRVVAHPSDVMVDGLTFYRCDKPTASDGPAVAYFALRPEAKKWEGQWTEFSLWIHCPKADCGRYEGLLRTIVRRMHFEQRHGIRDGD
jgi:hypothetical protein